MRKNSFIGGDIIKLCIFDLDGVICDTAKYHYLAWKELADELGIAFTEQDNERLKGISRMESLDILLSLGSICPSASQKEVLAQQKNRQYLEYVDKMTPDELLPGVYEFIQQCKNQGCKIALGSVSKNSKRILERLNITSLFDYIVDGTCVTRAKPDPQVFIISQEYFKLRSKECVVFEDAAAGVEAARRAHMLCVGIGSAEILSNANIVIPGFVGLSASALFNTLQKIEEATL